MYERHGASDGDFHFTSNGEGEYKLCFTAKGACVGRLPPEGLCLQLEVLGRAALAAAGCAGLCMRMWRVQARPRRVHCQSSCAPCACSAATRWAARLAPTLSPCSSQLSLVLATPPHPPRTRCPAAAAAAADYHTAQATRIRMKWSTGAEAHDWEAVAKKDNLNVIQVRAYTCMGGYS